MTVNAQINKTFLGFSDKGTIGCEIVFLYLDEGQSKEITTKGIEINSVETIAQILSVVGVNIWEELKGKVVTLKFDSDGIVSIINILDYRKILSFRIPETSNEPAE